MPRPSLTVLALTLPLPLLAALLLEPAPAVACSWPPPTLMVNDPPANGLLVVTSQCWMPPCGVTAPIPATLTVTDLTTLATVTGTIERVRGSNLDDLVIAWRPDTPFVEGRSYELDWNPRAGDPGAHIDRELVAQASASWTLADLQHGAQLDRLTDYTETIECEARATDSCGGNTHTVSIVETLLAALSVHTGPELEPVGARDHYAVRAAFWREGDPEPALGESLWPFQGTHRSFEEAASAYCYRIELTSLLDDSTEMRSACVEHGALGELGSAPRSGAVLADDVTWCKAPPAGLEAEWCAGVRQRCSELDASARDQFECDSVDETCEGVEVLPLTDAGTPDPDAPTTGGDGDGDGAGTGGGNGGDGDGDGNGNVSMELTDDDAEGSAMNDSAASGLCSVTSAGSATSAASARGNALAALAFIVALGALAHGVRRRQRLRAGVTRPRQHRRASALLRTLASSLAFALAFVVNPAYLAGCGTPEEDTPSKAELAAIEEDLVMALDDLNAQASLTFDHEGETYELLLALEQSVGEDESARRGGSRFTRSAYACGNHKFFQSASACATVFALAVEGTLTVRRLGDAPATIVADVPVTGELHDWNAFLFFGDEGWLVAGRSDADYALNDFRVQDLGEELLDIEYSSYDP